MNKFDFLNKKNKKPKRVVILGSSGIIVKNLSSLLKKKQINFITLGSKKINLKKPDIYSNILRKKIKKNDCILFLAAEAPVKSFRVLINNIEILKTVITAIEPKKISHLIYISSDAVYSDVKNKITESTQTIPDSYHGTMHITREKILESYFSKKLCILRPTMIYGINDTHDGYGPNKFVRLIKNNQNIKLFGRGEERRDHIYIGDVIKIIFKCITRKAAGKLNLASGNVVSFKEIADILIKKIKTKSKIKYVKRVGPLQHNGFRPFNVKLLKIFFKEIKLKNVKIGINNFYGDLT
ncbi:MAG: Nucleoside-diphosphate-sugar epimerase [Pelagibacterales bacterium]|nr:Nucleoside-diphosphate-sugar epimerase [Pelagibacterales bacterium]|tara:strand:+ start:1081 stop:1968 length:888 start_codon:yes stop_codon:yes gene_type:complete